MNKALLRTFPVQTNDLQWTRRSWRQARRPAENPPVSPTGTSGAADFAYPQRAPGQGPHRIGGTSSDEGQRAQTRASTNSSRTGAPSPELPGSELHGPHSRRWGDPKTQNMFQRARAVRAQLTIYSRWGISNTNNQAVFNHFPSTRPASARMNASADQSIRYWPVMIGESHHQRTFDPRIQFWAGVRGRDGWWW